MNQNNLLKILFVEDLPSDVDLAVLELRKEKINFEYNTVCTKKELIKALKEFKPDLIISDYMMPSFNGLQALMEAKKFNSEIPFILCTGSVNEETAVECIKAGAEDYIIKEHLTRLPFAVKEALAQVDIRIEKRASELLLKDSEDKLQSIFSAAPVGIGLVVNRILMEVNDTFCNLLGYNRSELIGQSSECLYPTKEEYELVGKNKYQLIEQSGVGTIETRMKRKDGKILNILLSSTPLDRSDYSKGVTFTALDITSRKISEDELRDSHRSMNTLISNLQGMVYRCRNDKNWTMQFMSEGTRELTGYSPEDFFNNRKISFNDLIHEDDRDYVWNEVQEAIKVKKHFQCTYRIITKSGEIHWVWEKGEGIFMPNGDLEFIEGFITDITERKSMEEALRLSEEKFRSIAENLTDVIFLTDREGVINYISPSSSMFGYTPEECTGRFFGEFLAEGELEKALSVFTNALNSVNIDASATLLFKRKEGSNFFAELSGSVFKVGDQPTGVLGLLRDVSDKMNIENELRKLSRAVEQSTTSIIITDILGKIEYINSQLCDITGYSKEELIGENPRMFSSKEKSKEEYKDLWDTINSGNDWKGEFHNKKKNGDLFWESASVSPIKNEKNEITHFLAIKEDVTMRKILEAKTIASEQRYRELFLNNPIPTYIFDEKTLEFIEVNDATVHNYGFSRQDFASMTLIDIRDPEDIPDLLESVKDLGKDVFHSISMHHRRKNGITFPVEITSHSLPEKNGRKTRLVMAIDITEQVKAAEQMKLAKEKAEASDKLKTTFLNNISHEVRTPLNGILGFAEIMSQPYLSDEDKKESLSMLFESSDRLLNTITNYMDISLITSGNLSLYRKEFNPGQFLRSIFDNFNIMCSERNLKLLLNIPEDSNHITINTDQEIFQKILFHLLNNAIKFTEEGSIQYGYVINDGEIEFFVKDTGPGIGKESIDNIFDRFVKADHGTSNLSEGSGLGLSIAKGMIKLAGGKLWVESELSVGSSFYFTIPLETDTAGNNLHHSDQDSKKNPAKTLILVADDDDTTYYYFDALLKREIEATILHASNGREAIQIFKSNPGIVLILMDVKMPEIDGLEATKQIKLLNKEIPVIAITAYAMSGDEERVLAAGCDGYLSKPISKKTLLSKMSEFIEI